MRFIDASRRRASSASCSEAEPWAFCDFLVRAKKNTATVAKERLRIIVAQERAQQRRGRPDYLPLLRRELLEVIRKYVNVDRRRGRQVHLESRTATTTCSSISVALPDATARRPPRTKTRLRPPAKPDRAAARTRAAASTRIAMDSAGDVLRLASIDLDDARALLARYGLALECVADGAAIPGSYWGEPEAGADRHDGVRARRHAGAFAAARSRAPDRAAARKARDDPHRRHPIRSAEEDATCYCRSLLGDALPGVGRERMLRPTWTPGATRSASVPRAPGSSATPRMRARGSSNAISFLRPLSRLRERARVRAGLVRARIQRKPQRVTHPVFGRPLPRARAEGQSPYMRQSNNGRICATPLFRRGHSRATEPS